MKIQNEITKSELLSCIELGKTLTSVLDTDELFGKILKKISDMIPADIWSLLLIDRLTGELCFKMSTDLDMDTAEQIRLKPGEGIAGQVAQSQEPLVIPDVTSCEYFSGKVDVISGVTTQSITCVPLVFGGDTVGVIEAINPHSQEKKDLEILKIIADYTAIAVENTNRFQRIENLAIRDHLTGLYNNHFLYEKLEELGEISRKTGTPLSLVFMDLDNFKYVVDTYNHLNGSQALKEVAATIVGAIEKDEFGVRYGGDEFIAVLPGSSKKTAIEKAEKIRTHIKQTEYLTTVDLNVSLSASFGVATFPDDANTITDLLTKADKAMFNIKDHGKDAVCGISDDGGCME